LVELLVVVLIILIVSAAALPVVLPAYNHRQVSEAARMLQGALVGAHDSAIHGGGPAGIRLLPDPVLNGINTNPNSLLFGQLDPSLPFCANRYIPIEPVPDYAEGMVSIVKDNPQFPSPFTAPPPFPGLYYPTAQNPNTGRFVSVLMVEECPIGSVNGVSAPNAPTNWFWNIRVGEKITIGNSGQIYTVVGPMAVTPNAGNSDWFVNDGPPGSKPLLQRNYLLQPGGGQSGPLNVEYLFVVNGLDDDVDGFVDNGWDGVDNNLDGNVDEPAEWTEPEQWQGSLGNLPTAMNAQGVIVPGNGVNLLYNITRRPVPSSKGREITLPSGVVIDLTTWSNPSPERSRLPFVASNLNGIRTVQVSPSMNPYNGYVDILVNPDGTVVPTTLYSSPSSSGLGAAYYHFWLAERGDVVGTRVDNNGNPIPLPNLPMFLPVGNIQQQLLQGAQLPANVPELKGEYRLVTLFARTGQVVTNDNVFFDNPINPQAGPNNYNPSFPFLQAQQGITGGQ
jgi:type II secretory pathway pseudopilin PulG